MIAARAEALHLYDRHPEARAEGVLRRWFWSNEHWLFVRFVVGLLLRKRHPAVGLMLAAPYIAEVSGDPTSAPLRVATDALEVATVLRAAVRHRTLMI